METFEIVCYKYLLVCETSTTVETPRFAMRGVLCKVFLSYIYVIRFFFILIFLYYGTFNKKENQFNKRVYQFIY